MQALERKSVSVCASQKRKEKVFTISHSSWQWIMINTLTLVVTPWRVAAAPEGVSIKSYTLHTSMSVSTHTTSECVCAEILSSSLLASRRTSRDEVNTEQIRWCMRGAASTATENQRKKQSWVSERLPLIPSSPPKTLVYHSFKSGSLVLSSRSAT